MIEYRWKRGDPIWTRLLAEYIESSCKYSLASYLLEKYSAVTIPNDDYSNLGIRFNDPTKYTWFMLKLG